MQVMEAFWAGKSTLDLKPWGVSMIVWGRGARLLEIASSAPVLLDIIGEKRVTASVANAKQRLQSVSVISPRASRLLALHQCLSSSFTAGFATPPPFAEVDTSVRLREAESPPRFWSQDLVDENKIVEWWRKEWERKASVGDLSEENASARAFLLANLSSNDGRLLNEALDREVYDPWLANIFSALAAAVLMVIILIVVGMMGASFSVPFTIGLVIAFVVISIAAMTLPSTPIGVHTFWVARQCCLAAMDRAVRFWFSNFGRSVRWSGWALLLIGSILDMVAT
jgi:hypothetical protein